MLKKFFNAPTAAALTRLSIPRRWPSPVGRRPIMTTNSATTSPSESGTTAITKCR
jgi:hypothetical protein